eukprot:15439215-Alexandrium_andersonii.AAC.1
MFPSSRGFQPESVEMGVMLTHRNGRGNACATHPAIGSGPGWVWFNWRTYATPMVRFTVLAALADARGAVLTSDGG